MSEESISSATPPQAAEPARPESAALGFRSSGPESDAPRGLATALLLVLLVATTALVFPTIAPDRKPGPDEFYYLSYAQTIGERGPGAFRDLFRAHVEESRHWLFPSPLRVGFLTVAALWTKLDGVSPASLGHLALTAHLASIALLYRLAARELGAARALFAATLFAASPLALGMARSALQDNFATLAALAVLSTFWSALARPESGRRLALFAGALAFAVLVKESLVLLVPPLLVWLAFDRGAGGSVRSVRLVRIGGAIGAALALVVAVWIVAAGSVETVRKLVEIVLRSPSTNVYALRFGGGGWYRYAIDFVALSAGPTLLAVAGLGVVLARARAGEGERLLLFSALLVALFVAETAFLTKNVRYVLLLEAPLRLLAVEALWRIVPARSSAVRVGFTALAVLLLAALDVASFRHLFVARGLYDPVSQNLLELRGVVPPS